MPEAVPRILGIDPGKTRVGLAITDGLGVTAQGLDTYVRGRGDFLAHLAALVDEYAVGEIALGLPLNMDGSDGEAATAARRFAEKLRRRFGIPVTLVDERLSSAAARAAYPPGSKRDWDRIAAQFILRTLLDSRAGAGDGE